MPQQSQRTSIQSDEYNMKKKPEEVVEFYNKRGTAELYIKEGKHTFNWTRLSCKRFRDN